MKKKKLLTLIGSICLILVLASLPFMGACAKPAPAPTPAPTPAPAPVPAGPFELKIGLATIPPGLTHDRAADWFIDQVEMRSEGQIKFEKFYDGSLHTPMDILSIVGAGTEDVGIFCHAYNAGELPVAAALTHMPVPFIYKNPIACCKAYWQLMDMYPQIKEEFRRNNNEVIAIWSSNPYELISRVPLRTLDDFKGKKMRAVGLYAPKFLEALGASTSFMPMTEVYDALSRGVLDAAGAPIINVYQYKLYEAAKYMIDVRIGTGAGYAITVNLDLWNKLPPNLQRILGEVGREYSAAEVLIMTQDEASQLEEMKKAGLEIIKLSPADMETWANHPLVLEQKELFIQLADENGLPGRQMMDDWVKWGPELDALWTPTFIE